MTYINFLPLLIFRSLSFLLYLHLFFCIFPDLTDSPSSSIWSYDILFPLYHFRNLKFCAQELRNSSSDDLNRRLVLDSLPITFPVILDLFNYFLNSSSLPSIWKTSYVILISKVKNSLSPFYFRLIFLLFSFESFWAHNLWFTSLLTNS